ncbi:hypothetical protein [Burkholderia cenocepacia]|uniref:hypothetical protein n=1 Tax=Burkholderia cenocepacia TaxID=95486 RepID=UPI00264B207F|nr:hypothetical protein [Burkholderia cenocepacia]MDN7452313.1 hypothetical protein [Burkholderia cenocepacia]
MPSRESGQALVPALLFLLVGGIGLYIAFNSLQLTGAKIKLQNAADASAYAAAVLQARDYNFSAYANRAMVANQASLAQIVSLKSFIDMLDNHMMPGSLTDRLANQYGNSAKGWLDAKWQARSILSPVRRSMDANLPVLASSLDSINAALSVAQRDYHETTFVAVPDLTDVIARANEPRARVVGGAFDDAFSKRQLLAWRTYSATFDPGTGTTDRFADVVTDQATLGNFAVRRDVGHGSTGVTRGCGGTVGVSINSIAIGGTQLRPDRRGWQALDAADTSLSTDNECVTWEIEFDKDGRISYKKHTQERVLRVDSEGTAGATNGNVMGYQSWRGYGGYVNFGFPSGTPGAVMSGMWSQYWSGPGRSISIGGGLQPYRDLTKQGRGNVAPRITVRLERPTASLVRDPRVRGGGRMKLPAGRNPVMAIASAQAYFARPDEARVRQVFGLMLDKGGWSRKDGRTEYPSLFNPYWEARLAAVTDEDRAAAAPVSATDNDARRMAEQQ